MAEAIELVTQARQGRGSIIARKLRKQGLVPAVVYGHGEGTASISINGEALLKAVRHGAHVVDLKTGDQLQKALIRELQWDHLGKELLHADFARISKDDRVVVPVPVHIRGQAPGVSAGGALDQPLHTLEIECPAIAVPEHVRVNVGELQIGSAIYVRDLHLPEGCKAMDDPDAIVVQVKAPEVEAAAAAPAAGETAEPEVIGRKVAEEAEEEEKK
jgi:large subunit ribosomal protein L25